MNNLIAPFKQTKWIVLSSFSFILPSLFGLYKKEYCLSTASTCVFLCSLNYWRDARYSIRRNIDIIVAYTVSLTYVIYGHLYVGNSIVLYTGFPIGCIIYGLYNTSKNKYYANKHNFSWVKYHMLFHFITACEQVIVINYSTNNNNLLYYI